MGDLLEISLQKWRPLEWFNLLCLIKKILETNLKYLIN